ncbi:phosphoenolpyruvate--protein phosphotransferase [Uliginosibacterium gangwonense]|uniref:phosphoenolpyruvate--protein phosphotransferase n=1 Tax=Uliginosibacterium gangwonense TaxID=392736 RepID=UPI000367637A|nr:phosphoenolpyruvate--protein phosphotransferase [Uliginosibacterium gangwonense]
MTALKGIAASPGVVLGRVFVYTMPRLEAVESRCHACHRCAWFGCEAGVEVGEGSVAEAELKVLHDGIAAARDQLENLVERVRAERGDDLAEVFEGHLEILTDEGLDEEMSAAIVERKLCAYGAIREGIEHQRNEFLALEDEYLRERADDLADIGRRLLYATAGVPFMSLGDIPEGVIIVARDLTPSDTAQLDPSRVGGFAVETGGRTSHTAIMARTLELPAVVGCVGILDAAQHALEGKGELVLDGGKGEVVFNPSDAEITQFEQRRAAYLADREAMLALASLPATTRDGQTVMLGVNIGTPADASAAIPWNPDGVGLYRSEFLFMDQPTLPTEDQQFKAYATVAKVMKGKPVILRTLDVGGDKPVAAIPFPEEDNPFLGWRGVRMCLYAEEGNQGVLRTQLRAALRAAAEGDVWVMYPMISAYEEVLAIKALLAEVQAELHAQGKRYGQVKTGIMVETPGAAMIADKLAEIVDFFSIGSNDLTQYTLAADRGNQQIARCYQTFHPAVWRLVAEVIKAGKARGIPVGMCGELAGIEEAALPLLGLGLDEYSMSAQSLPRIKRIIRAASMDQACAAAQAVLQAHTAAEAHAVAHAAMRAVLE